MSRLDRCLSVRDFEREADGDSVRILRAAGQSPAVMAASFERLTEYQGKAGSDRGIIAISASIRGSTRNSTGWKPRVRKASISSFTCMVPSWAAKAAPVRPAMMMPVMMAPMTRTMAMPTMVET